MTNINNTLKSNIMDTFKTKNGKTLKVTPIKHASMEIDFDGRIIQIDPVIDGTPPVTDYTQMAKADLERDRAGLDLAQPREAPDEPREPIPAQVADRVVDDRRGDDRDARRRERVPTRRRQGEQREADSRH